MSNRQARREQMRSGTPQRGAQRPSGRPGRPSGPPRRSSSSVLTPPFLIMAGVLVLAMVGFLAFIILNSDDKDTTRVDALRGVSLDGIAQNGNRLGADDAPLKLAMFEDFQCPFCLRYTADQEPQIINEYVKTGKVQLIYQNLPILGRESVTAARAGVCAAAQNKFWDLHNKLFLTQAEANQAEAEKIDDGRFTDDKLKQMARDLGMDGAAFDTCYSAPETLTQVQSEQQKAQSYGFRSTPSFTINDQSIGSGALASFDDWKKALDQALTATASGTATPSASATAVATPSASASAASSATSAASPTATVAR